MKTDAPNGKANQETVLEAPHKATSETLPEALSETPQNADLSQWPRVGALALIRFYQTRISPLTPPACRFHPTCSHYTGEAIERFGLVRGAILGAARVCKCNPLHRGGLDLVPEKFPWRVRSKSTVLPSSLEESSPDRKKF